MAIECECSGTMSDSLPTTARTDRVTTGALDPTEVVLGPRPVEYSGTDETKVIVGEVLGGRHRATRARRRGPGPVGAAVLSATGIVAGLSLLFHHDSAASAAPAPSTSAPDRLPDQAATEPVAATAAVPAGQGGMVPVVATRAVPAAAKPAAATTPTRHPASSTPSNSVVTFQDWANALRQAAAKNGYGGGGDGWQGGYGGGDGGGPGGYGGGGHHGGWGGGGWG